MELIENLAGRLIDDVVDRPGPVIEAGHRRENYGAVLAGLGKQTKMAEVERGLAHYQHKLPPFFEGDVSRPGEECVVAAVGDGPMGS
jgi:hypothetical protein